MDSKHIAGCLCYWCNEHRKIEAERLSAEAVKEVQERANNPQHVDGCMCYYCVEAYNKFIDRNFRMENISHDDAIRYRDSFPADSVYWWQWQCLTHHLSATHYREQMVKAQDELSLIRRLNQQRKEEAATQETETANSLQAELDVAQTNVGLYREQVKALESQLEAAKRETQLYQSNALYWKAQYDRAVAEQGSASDDEVHKLTITCHVLARMLASAYDTD